MSTTLPLRGRAARHALVLVALIAVAPSLRAQAARAQAGRSAPRPSTIEMLSNRIGALLVQSARAIGTVAGRPAGTAVDSGSVAVEIRRVAEAGTAREAYGLAVIVDDESLVGARQAWVDFDELDGLLSALESLAQADTAASPFTDVTTVYRTRGQLVVSAFRDDAPWASVSAGGPSEVTVTFPRQRLGELRALVQRAKQELATIRGATSRDVPPAPRP